MIKMLWTFIFILINAEASVDQAKYYIQGNSKYIVFDNKLEVQNNERVMNVKKIKTNETSFNKLEETKGVFKEEERLLRIIINDDVKSMSGYLLEEGSLNRINSELRSKTVFKYSFHQAIINKSYKVLLILLKTKGVQYKLVEKSGTSTMDILKMFDLENSEAGKEFMKEYYEKIKRGK